MEATKVTLPSGRIVEVRPPNLLDAYRIRGILPDVSRSAPATTKAKKLEWFDAMATIISSICLCSVKPKFWSDMRRDQHERESKPLQVPAGAIVFDLSTDDAIFLSERLTELGGTDARVGESAPTATG